MAAPLPEQDRDAAIAGLRRQLVDNGTAPETRCRGPAEGGDIPVHRFLRTLIPGGVPTRGTIVAAPPRTGATFAGCGAISYVMLALLAVATAGGAWASVIGCPSLGIAAMSGLGADLSKVLLLDEPGDRWPDAAVILAAAVDLVVLHAPRQPNAAQRRRLNHCVRPTDRQRRCVLIVTSPWETAHLVLSDQDPRWEDPGDGTGNLTRRRITVSAIGRATHGRHREVELWLLAADGTISQYAPEQEQQPESSRPRLRIA